ncbi:transcriptional regulator protein-like protein [Marine Group I thaumarchaeote SCGC AAA799-E16]|uniref:Transcriptional regulator protein-like protein n=4 Tax=Marine Group I TaxID=905826 RepID=A0A081RMV1_9ARCH|nr:transcriptional regulator protein-like protein [Marine Group I thaumarchaeote SCGC AAA799-N04]KER05640.1 transcriptional regulator protein-like protein [Marine Group I thaumarchaeote SCGC AAA799-E16]KFM15577.1 transcriptional regulator protein-like protein [Marine Group I thaumarchaeote SCGC AAA799-D11]KFM16777.1 transcriptional regulator protein-like protein [Marine Group I thaumarchaeote SCGC RSA3]
MDFEETSAEFLELASEVRLRILFDLLEKPARLTTLSKRYKVSPQEIHRNFERMVNSNLVAKQENNFYSLTTFGKAICTQIHSFSYLSQNKDYFKTHNFETLPPKFLRRIGDLNNSQEIVGVSKVLESWKKIYKTGDDFIFNVLSETPLELMDLVVKRVKRGTKYRHIISENASIPKGRRNLLEKSGFYDLLNSEKIERRMLKSVNISVILNEHSAGLMFPDSSGSPDLRTMFYSDDEYFREWCLDYFKHCWNISDPFKEFKLKE